MKKPLPAPPSQQYHIILRLLTARKKMKFVDIITETSLTSDICDRELMHMVDEGKVRDIPCKYWHEFEVIA